MSEAVDKATVDITPSPRVLRMLGQIDFAPWQCLAELIDNSIDAFLDQVASGNAPAEPKIWISLPTQAQLNDGTAVLEIKDNGSGMLVEDLGNAVKAGYSGNDPVEKMGLFGMGFNISTARLGRRTEVWTTTRDSGEWTGIIIDFDELEQRSTFHAPLEVRPKSPEELEQGDHGTLIKISRLDADRIRPLTRGSGKSRTIKRLGKIYGRVMSKTGLQISYAGDLVHPVQHCVWDKSRSVDNATFGKVPALVEIEQELPSRRYCTTCWVWLSEKDKACNACGLSDHVIERKRTLRGWLGIQRYFHKQHYGIDLIRNGRVIEELDKSFFTFEDDEGETLFEYPVDATHWGGRIVGELEIDFVRVSHQKDSFDKLDPEWKGVVEAVRGRSPIQPMLAKRKGLETNTSHLARLFAGYRKATAGLACLVPGTKDGKGLNTGPVLDYVERFHSGEEEYQSDDKWYELVHQAERAKRGGGSSGGDEAEGDFPIDDSDDDAGDEDANNTGENPPPDDGEEGTGEPSLPEPEKDGRLSQVYELEDIDGSPSVTVEALEYYQDIDGQPYRVRPDGRTFHFSYNSHSPFFEESSEDPAEYLITDLSSYFQAISGQSTREYPVSRIARLLKDRYFPELSTGVENVATSATSMLDSLKRHFIETLPNAAPIDITIIPAEELQHIRKAAAQAESASRSDVEKMIQEGTFAHYVTDDFLLELSQNWPMLITNGEFFIVPFESGSSDGSSSLVLSELIDSIRDILWLKGGGISAINKNQLWRRRYARAVASLRLLESWRS